MTDTPTQTPVELDARGLLCPMPIIRTAKAMKDLTPGQELRIQATDRGSVADIPAWAESTGNDLVEWHEQDGVFVFLLRKGAEG